MDLKEKIGQMLVYGWQGETGEESRAINAHARALIEEFAVGGIILMGRNIGPSSPAQVRALTEEFQDMARAWDLPSLLVGVDQEGGRVSRFKPPHFQAHPSAAQMGENGDTDQVYESMCALGSEMRGVGVNWVYAPILDINNNPANPVIGDRSYGDSPDLVSKMGVAAVRGLQEGAGTLACGKHFPGHGDTDIDSHLALPVVDVDRDRLKAMELVPFAAAIQAGIGSLMTSHILFPQVDPDLPATLSPIFLTELLRNEMGFGGVIITDCLEMKGVAAKWGSADAAVLAAIAGADMLLACHTYETQKEIHAALLDAVRTGLLSETRIDEANRRIRAAKERWVAA
ncbi:MAG TPA: beta-N-acetylhexosaminidase [Capsulimonadaceae bacterium]|nr:beta-N-acetylhexosaminidase [Capsulimonadaceae bacterium]